MKKLFLIAIIALSINAFSQKVVKEYYDIYRTRVKFEYQVDNTTGVKNGYYKSYFESGVIFESGFYNMGKKDGLWNSYDMYGKGQVEGKINYKNDLQNGESKSWCWTDDGKIHYLCDVTIFDMGKEISFVKYYSNGRKSEQKDKNGYFAWFNDGSPKSEEKNGKTYIYGVHGNDYIGYFKVIESVSFDSLNVTYSINYSYDIGGGKVQLSSVSIYATENNVYEKFHFEPSGYLNSNTDNFGNKIATDSTYIRKAYLLLNIERDKIGNIELFNKISYIYNEKTGDLKIMNADKSYIIEHYYSEKSPYLLSTSNYDKDGKKTKEIIKVDCKRDGIKTIERTYKNGIICLEDDFSKRIKKEYYDNGKLKLEHNVLKGFGKEFYQSGKVSLEYGISTEYGSVGNTCCYYYEYYETGKLKSEILTEDSPNNSVLSNDHIFYDEVGNVVKIVEDFRGSGGTELTITDIKGIGDYVIHKYEEKYKIIYLIENRTWNSNGYYKYSYQYPKGEEIYKKSQKVLDDITKRFTKAESDDIKKQALTEYKTTIEKLIKLSKSDLTSINEQLSKVKKIEDIKMILGL
ncbi:MAG: hypothetical protein WC223_09255 [Bacteroidales bacterium]|jgi:antitoxin component YwqK of YwqJK toxin-antitoxin module